MLAYLVMKSLRSALLNQLAEDWYVPVQSKVVATVVANYCLWPAAHYINFKFVPSEHRCDSGTIPSMAQCGPVP